MYSRQIVAGHAPPNPPPMPPTAGMMSRVWPPLTLFCELVNMPAANEYCVGRAPMKKADWATSVVPVFAIVGRAGLSAAFVPVP